jgi:hypothetical protein
VEALARGQSALKAKKWEEAQAAFREVLRHDESSLAGGIGLAEALVGSGQKGGGLALLRRTVDAAVRRGAATTAGREEIARAVLTLRSKDPEGTRLERLVDAHAEALVKVARQAGEDDPPLARSAVGVLTRLRPDHPDLSVLEVRLGLLPPGEALFNGRDASGWAWLEPPAWRIVDQEIHGEAKDVYAVARTTLSVSGDHDVRVEARVLDGGGAAVFFLQGGWSDFRENVSLGMMGSGVLLMEGRTMGTTADPPRGVPRKLRTKVDPGEWNLFELRFRRGHVTGYVNGEQAGAIPRTTRYDGGHVALTALLSKVAFRRLELVRR